MKTLTFNLDKITKENLIEIRKILGLDKSENFESCRVKDIDGNKTSDILILAEDSTLPETISLYQLGVKIEEANIVTPSKNNN